MLPRVLIVEDEPALAELIALNLRHNGLQPVQAADGAAAQREIDDVGAPDLIVLDWMLPDRSGILLARYWRADQRTRNVPIVMLTARDGAADRHAGLEAGVDDYITKPFSTQGLMARIRELMQRRDHGSGPSPGTWK